MLKKEADAKAAAAVLKKARDDEAAAAVLKEEADAKATKEASTPALLDRRALNATYHATGGPNWRNKNNWTTDTLLGVWLFLLVSLLFLLVLLLLSLWNSH